MRLTHTCLYVCCNYGISYMKEKVYLVASKNILAYRSSFVE